MHQIQQVQHILHFRVFGVLLFPPSADFPWVTLATYYTPLTITRLLITSFTSLFKITHQLPTITFCFDASWEPSSFSQLQLSMFSQRQKMILLESSLSLPCLYSDPGFPSIQLLKPFVVNPPEQP